jgi:chromosome segregation ATPase
VTSALEERENGVGQRLLLVSRGILTRKDTMEPADLTVQILREIRDGVNLIGARVDQTNARLDQTNARLGQTNARLDQTIDDVNGRFDRLERRMTETEIRIATEIVAVASAVREVRDELREDRRLRAQVDDHERRIGSLEKSRDEAAH